jgi:hypothetical protein
MNDSRSTKVMSTALLGGRCIEHSGQQQQYGLQVLCCYFPLIIIIGHFAATHFCVQVQFAL